jgi:predicted transcriptional regulator
MALEYTSTALEPRIKRGLAELAEREQRSKSWLINQILREGLAARSALPDQPAPKQSAEARQA